MYLSIFLSIDLSIHPSVCLSIEVNDLDDGAGTMEAVYFGNANGGLNHGGAGKHRGHACGEP
jgi:hypothetical protein